MNPTSLIFLLALSLIASSPSYAQDGTKDCLNLDSLVESLGTTPGHLEVDSVEILRDHSLVDLAKQFPRTFLADRSFSYIGQPVEWSAIAKSYHSGANISESFIETVKGLLSIGPKDEPPVFSADRRAGSLISSLLFWYSVQLPYGYVNDNTIYQKSLAQYQCKTFHRPGIGYTVGGGLHIVSSTPASLTYINKDGGEAFSISLETEGDERVLKLTRLAYVTTRHSCGENKGYEIHPVQVRYSIRWSNSATTSSSTTPLPPKINLKIPGESETASVESICSDTESQTPPRGKLKYFSQTSDLASHLDLPIATLTTEFDDRYANVNSGLAVKYIEHTLNRHLGADISLSAKYRLKVRHIDASDRNQSRFLSELMEKGTHFNLDAETHSQFCAEEGNIANISTETLRKHPELSCILRTEIRYNEYSRSTEVKVTFSGWEPLLKIESLPLPFAVDFVEGLAAAVIAKSPGNYGPFARGYRNWPFLHQMTAKQNR